MSIIYCEKHSRRWDSDKEEECPVCVERPETCSTCNAPIVWCKCTPPQPAPTPETDEAFPALVYENAERDGWAHAIDFARTLERSRDELAARLADMTAQRNDLHAACSKENERAEQAEAALKAAREKYEELLYAVGNKYPGESRHETALRYIRRAEKPFDPKEQKQADAAIARQGR